MYWCRRFINSGVVGGVSVCLDIQTMVPGGVPFRTDPYRPDHLSRHTHKRPPNLRHRKLRDRTLGNALVLTVSCAICPLIPVGLRRAGGRAGVWVGGCVWGVCWGRFEWVGGIGPGPILGFGVLVLDGLGVGGVQ